jgi:hypothetical protein
MAWTARSVGQVNSWLTCGQSKPPACTPFAGVSFGILCYHHLDQLPSFRHYRYVEASISNIKGSPQQLPGDGGGAKYQQAQARDKEMKADGVDVRQ